MGKKKGPLFLFFLNLDIYILISIHLNGDILEYVWIFEYMNILCFLLFIKVEKLWIAILLRQIIAHANTWFIRLHLIPKCNSEILFFFTREARTQLTVGNNLFYIYSNISQISEIGCLIFFRFLTLRVDNNLKATVKNSWITNTQKLGLISLLLSIYCLI